MVPLPDQLTKAISLRMGVDPDRYAAPAASVQTLADAASPYGSKFHCRGVSRVVGVPLLVHHRCAEPMFGIANAIAYGGMMVSVKRPGPSPIRDVLGPSAWLNVEGTCDFHWCAEEGERVLELLRQLAIAKAKPDLYIITPFVVVAEQLRQLVRASEVLNGWVPEDEDAWVRERIGTVHTAQGREAEAVILVLGASSAAETWARNWAGGRPNLLNVAVTRAKEVLYIVGNRRLWREAGVFGGLDIRLKEFEERERKLSEERRQLEAEALEKVRREIANRERAERMEHWKRSAVAREWVQDRLAGWDHLAFVELTNRVRATRFWPLDPREMLACLEIMRDELRKNERQASSV